MGMHDKIRMMREFRQLSQEDMAEKMNMSQVVMERLNVVKLDCNTIN